MVAFVRFRLALLIITLAGASGVQARTLELPANLESLDIVPFSESYVGHETDWRRITEWREAPNLQMAGQGEFGWLRTSFHEGGPDRIVWLRCDVPWPENVELFVYQDGILAQHSVQGDGLFQKREFRNPAFRLNTRSGSDYVLLLRISADSRIPFTFHLLSERAFLNQQLLEERDLGLFLGIVLMFALFHTVLYFALSERALLFYVLWIVSVGIFQGFRTRLFIQFLPPELAGYSPYFQNASASLLAFCAIGFGRNFLELQRIKWMHLAALLLQGFTVLPILVAAFDLHSGRALENILGLLVGPPLLIFGILTYRRGSYSMLFLVAWSVPILAATWETLLATGVLPGLESRSILPWAFVVEFFIFAAVLRQKMASIMDQRVREQSQLRKVDAELLHARRIQQDLLPANLHRLPGGSLHFYNRPVREMGGDYYDVHIENGKVIVLMADVTGQGMSAALDAALVRLAFRYCLDAATPAELLRRMNEFLYPHLDSRFVSAACLFCDLESGEGILSLAGHPAGLLLGKQSGILECDSWMLGILEHWKGEEIAFRLEAGERILLFSDSVISQDNRSAYESVIQKLSANLADGADAMDSIRTIAEARDGQPSDDVTIAVIEKSPSAKGDLKG